MDKYVNLKCIKEDFLGNGIVIYNKEEKKIPGLLEGEEATFKIEINGKYTNLILDKILTKSINRIEAKCHDHLSCGGCQYQHMSYAHELEIKNNWIKELFSNLKNIDIKPVISTNNPYNYRNKCQMTYKLSKTKNVVCGFYEEGTHKIVPINDCKIQVSEAYKIINTFNKILTKNHIEPYNEKTKKGIIRHIVLKYGINTKEVMLCIVTNGEIFPGRNNVVKDLLASNLGITTIVQNYNSRDTSIVLGDKERVLYGKGYIIDTIKEYKFKISSRSFYQVNPEGMALLYDKVIDSLNIKKTDIILDTYCGVGTIGILMSKYAKEVYGVELNKDAYKDAIENAKLNNIKNIRFFNDDSTRFVKNLASNKAHIDLLVLDPPRDGSTKDFINSIAFLKPKKVIYVSCEPKTLKRDLYDFTKAGFIIKSIQPVDMFPRTFNLECVCQLVLQDKKN
ncbi:MAG: 23S rRNA (uracil(1939)-C(5))-methyltransferase RlmD [Anaeroplasmataceae bacterium]